MSSRLNIFFIIAVHFTEKTCLVISDVCKVVSLGLKSSPANVIFRAIFCFGDAYLACKG